MLTKHVLSEVWRNMTLNPLNRYLPQQSPFATYASCMHKGSLFIRLRCYVSVYSKLRRFLVFCSSKGLIPAKTLMPTWQIFYWNISLNMFKHNTKLVQSDVRSHFSGAAPFKRPLYNGSWCSISVGGVASISVWTPDRACVSSKFTIFVTMEHNCFCSLLTWASFFMGPEISWISWKSSNSSMFWTVGLFDGCPNEGQCLTLKMGITRK